MNGDRVRGNVDVGLSRLGKSELKNLADDFGRLGGLDVVFASPLYRMRKTAKAIVSPRGQVVVTPVLFSWSMGEYEGWPSDAAADDILRYVLETPDEPIPGIGPYTGQPGGRFSEFCDRFLNQALKPALETVKQNPKLKIGMIVHSRTSKLTREALKQGLPERLKVTEAAWNREDPPAAVHVLKPGRRGWQMQDLPGAPESLEPGCLYAVRHVATWWSKESYGKDGKPIS